MFTRLNKANGYYAGKSYGSFDNNAVAPKGKDYKTEDKSITRKLASTISGDDNHSALKWGVIIAAAAVAAYLIYKHRKH